MKTVSHPYRPKPWMMALGCIFFGAIAVFMAREAMFNDRGLVLNGLLHLGTTGATIFYGSVAAVSAVFVAIAIPGFIVGLTSPHRVTVTDTEVSAPRFGFSRKVTTVRFADIRDMSLQQVQRQRFLVIVHAGGKLSLIETFLPNREAFDEICLALSDRVRAQPPA